MMSFSTSFRVFIFLFYLLSIPGRVFAQQVPTGRAIDLNGIIDLAQGLGGFLIVLGAVLGAITVILSGIIYMLARGDASKVKAAKDTLKGGIIGTAIIWAAGMIVNTIQALVQNPETFLGM